MAKAQRTTQPSKTVRSTKTGEFLGRSRDGTWIVRPDFKPKSFSVRELRKAVRDVQRRESEARAS